MRFISHASGSAGNLYQVVGRCGEILIDPGIPIKRLKQALSFRLPAMQAALISHYHGDHSASVKKVMAAGVDCYMSEQTSSHLGICGHRCHIIEPLKQVEIGGWSVIGFPTQHDAEGSLGFLVTDGDEKLLYATDTFYVRYRFKGVHIIAVECNYSHDTLAPDLNPVRKKRLYKSHFSLENVKQFLMATDLAAVREIHLLHISKGNGDPDWFKSEIQRVTGKPTYTVGD